MQETVSRVGKSSYVCPLQLQGNNGLLQQRK